MRGEGILDQVSPYREASSVNRCGLGDAPLLSFSPPSISPVLYLSLAPLALANLDFTLSQPNQTKPDQTQPPFPSTFPFSQTWYAVLDNSVNYCNLHNLVSAPGEPSHRCGMLPECLAFGCWAVLWLFSRFFYVPQATGALTQWFSKLAPLRSQTHGACPQGFLSSVTQSHYHAYLKDNLPTPCRPLLTPHFDALFLYVMRRSRRTRVGWSTPRRRFRTPRAPSTVRPTATVTEISSKFSLFSFPTPRKACWVRLCLCCWGV